jgi:hypothetical protein
MPRFASQWFGNKPDVGRPVGWLMTAGRCSGVCHRLTIVVVVLLVAIIVPPVRRMRSERVQEQFGPEYQRRVAETGDRKAAEADLRERQRRHNSLVIRDLRPEESATGSGEQGEAHGGTATNARATDTGGGGAAPATNPTSVPSSPSSPQQRSAAYSARWDEVKVRFVDEPRQAVAAADQLVGEVLEELQELFRSRRHDIDRGLDTEETSIEDIRVALRRYRSFFDRLLSV